MSSIHLFLSLPRDLFPVPSTSLLSNFTDKKQLNSKGEKVTVPAHGATIDIQGITVAHVNESVQLQSVETWFDPLEMFRQIAPNGIVNKTIIEPEAGQTFSSQLHGDSHDHHDEHPESPIIPAQGDAVTASGSSTEEKVAAEKKPEIAPGNAVVAPADSAEAKATHEEMSRITAAECPFLMSKE
jgi:hypothetical protein